MIFHIWLPLKIKLLLFQCYQKSFNLLSLSRKKRKSYWTTANFIPNRKEVIKPFTSSRIPFKNLTQSTNVSIAKSFTNFLSNVCRGRRKRKAKLESLCVIILIEQGWHTSNLNRVDLSIRIEKMLSVVRREFKILLLETSVSSVSSWRVARVVDDFVHKTLEPKKVWSAYKNIISANDRELVLNILSHSLSKWS